MYVVTALPTGPHAAPPADETATASGAAGAPDAALAANGGAAASAGGAEATPAGGEPASEGSDFGDVLQREQQGGAPAGSSVATPAHGRAARHHEARHDDAASPAPAAPLFAAVATSSVMPLRALALRPHGEGDEAADHAKSGDDQGVATGRLGLGQERGYAASGTGTAWSPERTVTLPTSMESQPQMPVVAADALAAAGATAGQAASASASRAGAADALQLKGQPREGSAPATEHLSLGAGHLSVAPVVPAVADLDAAPAVTTLPGAAASAPAHASDAKAATREVPATAEAAGTVQTGEQFAAALAAVAADLTAPDGTKLPAGTAPVADPRSTRDHTSNDKQTQEHGAAPAPVSTVGSDAAQHYGVLAPTVQPHSAQAADGQAQITLPPASIQATHGAAGAATAHIDSATAGIRHNESASHSEVAALPDGRAAADRDQGQQGAPVVTTPAGLMTAALPTSGVTVPDRGVGAAPGERSTAAVQHDAPGAGRHDGAPAPQSAALGSAAPLPLTALPSVTTPISISSERVPAAGTRVSGVETATHRGPGVAGGAGADSSMMPLRSHTAATAASGSAPFAVSQAMPAATGTAPAHHAAPKETAPASGFLAPVAEGIFVRLGSLRTTPSSSSFHVVLQPQALGTVSVHVQRGQDGLQVTLIPQQSATREILDRHMHELVSALGAADGAAPRVSVVAPGAASSGGFGGADQGMMGSGAFSAGSGGQQPSQGQGAQGESPSWDDTARPALTPAPMRAPAPRRAPLAAQRLGNASRVDFQA